MTYGTRFTHYPGDRVSQASVHLSVMQCRYVTNVHTGKMEVRANPLSAKSVILTSESKMSVGAVRCMHNDDACCLCRQLNDNLAIV
jgi:hypothetical protein